MSDETNTDHTKDQQKQKEYTPEELKTMRKKMDKFYQEELPHLKLQEEYERLAADIEEHKVRKLTMQIRGANIYAQQEQAQDEALANDKAYKAYVKGVEDGTIDELTGFPIVDGQVQYPEGYVKPIDGVLQEQPAPAAEQKPGRQLRKD